jgi:hypothetical protein
MAGLSGTMSCVQTYERWGLMRCAIGLGVLRQIASLETCSFKVFTSPDTNGKYRR